MVARADHKYVKMGWESKLKPTEVLAILPTEAQQLSQQHQSLYREVRWFDLYGIGIEIWAGFGSVGVTEKNIWANYEQLFTLFCFKCSWSKKNTLN